VGAAHIEGFAALTVSPGERGIIQTLKQDGVAVLTAMMPISAIGNQWPEQERSCRLGWMRGPV